LAKALGSRQASLTAAPAVIGVVDTGKGNLLSICNALDYLGEKASVCHSPEELADADRVIIPGVGAFREAMANLVRLGFAEALDEARNRGTPVLGICLGLQLMARRSTEGGETVGLGWLPGDVVRLYPDGLRVPHVGWNDVTYRPDSPLFGGLPAAADFYFVHSYHLVCNDDDLVDAQCDYGGPVTAAVRLGNVAAVQFHPEKSQDHGMVVLDNFLRWDP
jgi:glutamine amidotransferase